MRARIELTELEAVDSGERVAEPHLWVVFFKVDGSTYSTVLAHKLARGKIPPEELEHRGIPSVEKASGDRTSFGVPGFAAGGLKPMRRGEVRDLQLSWEVDLEGEGILHDDDPAIGCMVVGWEIDNGKGGGSQDFHDGFVADVRKRLFAEVRNSIESQPLGSGPYRLRLRNQPYLRQLDEYRNQTDQDGAVFASQDHEIDFVKAYGNRLGGGLDPDDLLGALVVVASRASMGPGRHTGERLWLPTAASDEGTWAIRFAVTFE